MQISDDNLQPSIDDGKTGRNLRKSTRIQIPRSAPDRSSVERDKEDEQSTPSSPRGARRKNRLPEADQKAEQNIESDSPTDVKTPASTPSTGSGDLSPHVCLCQPEPKIPRPRNGESDILCSLSRWLVRLGWLVALPNSENPILGQRKSCSLCVAQFSSAADSFVAFILYRQHHQQNIIRRNPGLNNPDISKIIGEQWKAESDEEKKVWQDLAQVGLS